MATMRQIRSRIRVAKNIQQITKAMKMVAAARLKRAQDRVTSARPYAAKMREVVGGLAQATSDSVEHPLLEKRPVSRTGVLVITADRGLCGSYNSGVIRKAGELLETLSRDDTVLYTIGRKGTAFFRRRGYTIREAIEVDLGAVDFAQATAVAGKLRQAFEAREFDELYVVYTQFVTAMTQIPKALKLLPAEPSTDTQTEMASSVIFEPSAHALLAELLPRYLVTQIYQALLESVASEHGSRMTSMSSATDNAGKMISTLTLSLNRARQAAITKEISEIVGGAESLKG
jgi:F-type H+-transporting ATPase subunit gamma